MTNRREFIALLGSAAAAWPLAARAQQAERMRRIGVLMNTKADDLVGQARAAAFHQALARIGLDRRQKSQTGLSLAGRLHYLKYCGIGQT
jgi:DNA-binding LacI/PurR family transcriptional regulator